jgi:hypothetical protein
MIISVENSLDKQSTTLASFLSTNGTAGGTVVPVKNINGFQTSWAIQLGRTGEEQAEILTISSIGGTALNTAGTARYAHPIDTPVYQTHYDSVIILRSTSGTTGTPTALSTVSITPDSFYTEYNDANGAATYAYQSQYYNSVNGDRSGTSSWFVPGGPTYYSLQRLRDRIKKSLFSSQYIKEDDTITDWINEWVEQMTNKALKLNQAYSVGTAGYSFGTASLGTVTASLFKYAMKIEVTWDGITYTSSTEIAVNQFSATDTFSSVSPRHYWQGDTIFGILPNGSSGTARFTLGQLQSELVNDTDELPQYLKGYTSGCLEYCLYKAYDLDQKQDIAESHYKKFKTSQGEFITDATPRDQTGEKYINFVEGIGSADDPSLADYFV